MQIGQIWRYPVKSMAGEPLQSAHVGLDGIEGDRLVQVYDGSGRVATSRTYPELLGLHATLGPDGQALVDGRPWQSREVLEAVRKIVGPAAILRANSSPHRFDVLPLLVATDGAIAAFGRDGRRLRPNIVIDGVDGLAERTWEGLELLSGNVVIGVDSLRGRCIMTSFDPDTIAYDPTVLRDIVRRFGGKLALNCEVIQGGRIETGMEVEVRDHAPLRTPGSSETAR